ncbi:MAG: hypothetical protein QM756_08690 [Polyangiaceae bacterium]
MNLRTILPVALLLAACGGPLKYQLASTPKAPGGDAVLICDVQDGQSQTQIEMTIEHLAPPGRVAEGATTFVAWFRKNSDTVWARIGGVQFDESARSGSLKGSVAEVAFDFEVTAEKAEAPASPSSDVVFSQRVEKK